MPHFAAGLGFVLAVEMQLDVGEGARGVPIGLAVGPEIAEQICHRGGSQLLGRSQGQSADGAMLLLELAGDTGVKGEMPRIVRPRGEFVDQQLAGAA